MADRDAVLRIAKLLARAESDNEHEAKLALEGAYKRMRRDGITLFDLLELPVQELYQSSLVKLVDCILNDQADLSPSSRREAYSQYMFVIASRFAGKWDGKHTADSSSKSNAGESDTASKSREEQAREYEQRRRDEERRRNNEKTSQGDASNSRSDKGYTKQQEPHSSQNFDGFDAFIPKSVRDLFSHGGILRFSFSPAPIFALLNALFGRYSITWYTLFQPGQALRLYAASLLYGFAFSAVILSIVAFLHAATHTRPFIDVELKTAFSFLTAVGFIFKARLLFVAGWFR